MSTTAEVFAKHTPTVHLNIRPDGQLPVAACSTAHAPITSPVAHQKEAVTCQRCRRTLAWERLPATQPTAPAAQPLPTNARDTISLAVRTLGDLLRTGDLDPHGTSYGVVTDLMADLRGLL